MGYSEAITWIAVLLQLLVACYALRLNRLFGVRRVGWSLFAAFALLAVSHLLQSVGPSANSTGEFGISVDLIYGLISLLLLVGMAHISSVLKLRGKVEAEEQRMRQELEERIKQKTLQMEDTYKELLSASHQAGMSEVATSVLHNVGNVLNSVNISATVVSDHLAQFKAANVVKTAALMTEHADNLGDFMTNDPKGKQLPLYLTQLGAHLSEEQALLLKEMGFVKKKIEHIKDIVAMQQSYALVTGVAEKVKLTDLVEDALQMNADALARHDVDIIREFDHHAPEITVEKHKVLQILINLIRNAKYACDESGRKDKTMTLRVNNGGDKVRLTVIDNGVGIPGENMEKIFSHGFTTRKGGHGFGLHAGALAAKEMGGALSAKSDGPGCGAMFTLELPLQPKKASPQVKG